MGRSQALTLALGALSVSSGVAMLTFDIIFAVSLPQTAPLLNSRVAAIVSSSLTGVDLATILLLVGRHFRYRNGGHISDVCRGRWHTNVIAGLAGIFGVLAAVASALLLVVTRVQFRNLSPTSSIISMNLVMGGFVIWAAFIVSQAVFVICIVVNQRRGFEQQTESFHEEPEREMFPQMEETSRTHAMHKPQPLSLERRGQSSMESRTPPSSSGRSRAGSDTMSSLRSSLSQVVRPITSKTKLIQTGHKSPHRPTSVASSHRDPFMEDGFDSWDTSAVDAHSRQAVESASPTAQRQKFLETIPASPTGSRSPSPGFPLDLEPPKTRQRSRSYSPANSPRDRERFQKSRTSSPTESMNEAHIHPLFRTDSPTPPPATTPSTIITAAPNAGQLISDRQSIRSIHRMRSGSLPSSPLGHSPSLDSIRRKMEREELQCLQEAGEVRTLTPPIPDFILNGGPRNSLSGYKPRKKSLVGLGKVGEVRVI